MHRHEIPKGPVDRKANRRFGSIAETDSGSKVGPPVRLSPEAAGMMDRALEDRSMHLERHLDQVMELAKHPPPEDSAEADPAAQDPALRDVTFGEALPSTSEASSIALEPATLRFVNLETRNWSCHAVSIALRPRFGANSQPVVLRLRWEQGQGALVEEDRSRLVSFAIRPRLGFPSALPRQRSV
jgi:hypothetical protein